MRVITRTAHDLALQPARRLPSTRTMAPIASSSRLQLLTPVSLRHEGLRTTFSGVEHAVSTPAVPITQFRGIRYATIPGRFRTARLVSEYEEVVDATRYGYAVVSHHS
jgi:hypothetical protein